ncbi:hypothetical protein PGO_030140 [Plasmodium gonderi]|uniref:Uncharacterized protein n=1 Tax=Plasmodium gonderi TaxID=77519 RepID=A0A1Y1JGK3_PLAGO|nr:hypothetical protein PGO_030140 [Plasmodium gonderi]GAW79214.1 hypothetical protein PGO_030140 [Plasmodium gonderi]
MKKRKCQFQQPCDRRDIKKKLRNRNKPMHNGKRKTEQNSPSPDEIHDEERSLNRIFQKDEGNQNSHNFTCYKKKCKMCRNKRKKEKEKIIKPSRNKETYIFIHNSSSQESDSSQIGKIYESTESQIFQSTNEFEVNTTTTNSTLSDMSLNKEENHNTHDSLIQVIERIEYTGNPYTNENYHLNRNCDVLETHHIYNVLENDLSLNKRRNVVSSHSTIESNNSNRCDESTSSNAQRIVNLSTFDLTNKCRHSSNHITQDDTFIKAAMEEEKMIMQNKLFKKMQIILPFYRKRIFIESICEHTQINKIKDERDEENLISQCYNVFCKIRECAACCSDKHTDRKFPNDELLITYFFNKLNKNKYDIKLKMDYYELEFFIIFFLTYFRFSLYLNGFINSSFLYHSNEVHFIIFVLNRYHYFVDHMYINHNSLPFTSNEIQDIMLTYKKCIISILDYLDAFYPFLLLISEVIEKVHKKFKKILHKLKKLEKIFEKKYPNDTHKPEDNMNHSTMNPHTIAKFKAIKKINKIKRKFFKKNGDKFAMLITENLRRYWIFSYPYDKGITKKKATIFFESKMNQLFLENDKLDMRKVHGELEKMILNTRNNMFVKYIIFSTLVKLNQILNSLEMTTSAGEAERDTYALQTISMSELLTFKALIKMKKKDKWALLLKHNYFYIEKSYYYFKELHEKKIIYCQIQNLFRSILNFKINVIYHPFIQHLHVEDLQNKNIEMIYDYIYYIKNIHEKNFLITLFVYNGLIYKLQFDVSTFGFLYSIYNSVTFLFFQKSYIHLVKENQTMKNKFMNLFKDIINSLNFSKYKNVASPTKNIIKGAFFKSENQIINNMLYSAMRKTIRMRYTGHITTNASLFYNYERLIHNQLCKVLPNKNEQNMVEQNYLIREIDNYLGNVKNKL